MIKNIFGKNWRSSKHQAIIRSVTRLAACLTNQYGSPEKEANIAEVLRQKYVLPTIGICKGRVQHFRQVKKQPQRWPISSGRIHKKC